LQLTLEVREAIPDDSFTDPNVSADLLDSARHFIKESLF